MSAKTLIYDIETAPNLGHYFELYKEGNILKTEKHWYILSVAWKWLGEKQAHVLCLADFPGYAKRPEDDKPLVKEIHKLFSTADIKVAHNGNSFDKKKCYARFIHHKLKPPPPSKDIDTKLEAKRYFKFDSNKLDDLGDYLGIGRKIETGGKELWFKCMSGDMKAWRKMCKYNKMDVILLEKVYLALLPYMTRHPDLQAFLGRPGCPKCGFNRLQSRGTEVTTTKIYRKFYCPNCGGWASFRTGEKLKGVTYKNL